MVISRVQPSYLLNLSSLQSYLHNPPLFSSCQLNPRIKTRDMFLERKICNRTLGDVLNLKTAKVLVFRLFLHFISEPLTSIRRTQRGTRGQKVRHLLNGSSDLIHGLFCPLGRKWEHINYTYTTC